MNGISTDIFGQQLMAELSVSNVYTCNDILSDRPTTLPFVQLTDGQASYLFLTKTQDRMITVEDMQIDLTMLQLFIQWCQSSL